MVYFFSLQIQKYCQNTAIILLLIMINSNINIINIDLKFSNLYYSLIFLINFFNISKVKSKSFWRDFKFLIKKNLRKI